MDSDRKIKLKQKARVLCPACNLILQVPDKANYFRCVCGITLRNPALSTEYKNVSGHGAAVKTETGANKISSVKVVSRVSQSPTILASSQTKKPPVYTNDTARADCEICSTPFTLLRRRHHCRCCGGLVCRTCSNKRWPQNMLPPSYNLKNEKLMRVCTLCHTSTESFRAACLQGDLVEAQSIYSSGRIHVECGYSIFPYALYPIHCAATSGNVKLVEWLLSLGCSASVTDGRGWSALNCAAVKPNIDLVRYLVRNGISSLEEIGDLYILRKCLSSALTTLDNFSFIISKQSAAGKLPPPAYQASTAKIYLSPPKCAPVPTTEEEEAEQVQIALAASRVNCVNVDERFKGTHGLSKNTGESDIMKEDPSMLLQTKSFVSDSDNGNAGNSPACIICFENPVATVFVPCGHSCCCIECSKNFKTECPVCRGNVEQVVRTYNICC